MESQPLFSISMNGNIAYVSMSFPKTFDDIIILCKEKLRLNAQELLSMTLLYKDHENDDIIISSQYDYEEALSLIQSKKLKQLKLTIENDISQNIPQLIDEASKDPLRSLNTFDYYPFGNNSLIKIQEQLEEKKRSQYLKGIQLLIFILTKLLVNIVNHTIDDIRLFGFKQCEIKEKTALKKKLIIVQSIQIQMLNQKTIIDRTHQKSSIDNDVDLNIDIGNDKEIADVNTTSVIHKNITCDICLKYPIIGLRYKCDECLNYNLCQECKKLKFYQLKQHDQNHLFIVIREPIIERYSYAIASNKEIICRRTNYEPINIYHSLRLCNTGDVLWSKAKLISEKESDGIGADEITIRNILPNEYIDIKVPIVIPQEISDGKHSCFLALEIDDNKIEEKIKINISIMSNSQLGSKLVND